MPMEAVPNLSQFPLTLKQTAAQQAESLRFGFAGMCCSETDLLAALVVQVQLYRLVWSFT